MSFLWKLQQSSESSRKQLLHFRQIRKAGDYIKLRSKEQNQRYIKTHSNFSSPTLYLSLVLPNQVKSRIFQEATITTSHENLQKLPRNLKLHQIPIQRVELEIREDAFQFFKFHTLFLTCLAWECCGFWREFWYAKLGIEAGGKACESDREHQGMLGDDLSQEQDLLGSNRYSLSLFEI